MGHVYKAGSYTNGEADVRETLSGDTQRGNQGKPWSRAFGDGVKAAAASDRVPINHSLPTRKAPLDVCCDAQLLKSHLLLRVETDYTLSSRRRCSVEACRVLNNNFPPNMAPGESKDERDERVARLWDTLDARKEGHIDLNGLKKGLKKIDHRES